MTLIDTIAAEGMRIAAELLEARIRAAMEANGVTEDDMRSGRAKGQRRTSAQCAVCAGHGVYFETGRLKGESVFLVAKICPCLEIVITRTPP